MAGATVTVKAAPSRTNVSSPDRWRAPSAETASLLAELEREDEQALHPARSRAHRVAKRAVDVTVASLLVVALSPLMLLVAALIKLTSRGPVLFRQIRAGKDGKPFTMLKFRTMRNGASDERKLLADLNMQSGPVFKIPDDPRLTPIGRFLRRSSIDELPQLFNVLRGEMSLVGPRPLWLPEALKVTGHGRYRTRIKPGLTCLWQISGRSELSYEEWVLLDLYYLRHRSLVLDLLIIIQTIPAVINARGAF